MNTNEKNKTMYETQPAISELNKVPGFDPLNFLRKTVAEETKQEVWDIDLKYKKLWFRLKYPKGIIKKNVLTLNEQIAVIEAKIFFASNDTEPVSSFIAQRYAKNKTGSYYIQSAQDAAVNRALTDAGFGIQLCDRSQGSDMKTTTPECTHKTVSEIVETVSIMPENDVQQDTVIQKPILDLQTNTEPAKITVDTSLVSQQNIETPVTPQIKNLVLSNSENITEYFNYTADMPVDEIFKIMTLEEAGSITVEEGLCKGWLMSDVMEKRPASLRWLFTGYTGKNNIMRAAAKMMFDYMTANKAAAA